MSEINIFANVDKLRAAKKLLDVEYALPVTYYYCTRCAWNLGRSHGDGCPNCGVALQVYPLNDD